jgi:hypothetical protein
MDVNTKLYSPEESLEEANYRHEEGCRTGSYTTRSETTRSETTRSETRREIRRRRRKGRVKIILAVAAVPPACLAAHWISGGSAPQAGREHPAIHASADQRIYMAPAGQGRTSMPAHFEQKGHRQRKSSSGPATPPAARLAATSTGAPQPAHSPTSGRASSSSDSPALTRVPAPAPRAQPPFPKQVPESSLMASSTPAPAGGLNENLLIQVISGIQGLIDPIGSGTA